MAIASSEIVQPNETQRAETAANRFYDMAEKGSGAKDPQAREMFSNVGRETADGGYDRAQRILESGAQWDDTLRGAASEVNQLDQEKGGAKPMSLEDAVGTISRYAEELQNTGSPEDALEVQKIAAGMIKTGQEGVEAAEKALQYIEGLQKSQVDRMSQRREIKGMDTLQSLQEKRSIRDALHQEKQKRVEQTKQSQLGTEELTKGRGETTKRLQNMFGRAGVPEDLPSRKEFFEGVQRMSPEELHFLDAALGKVMAEFGRSQQNPDLLGMRLQEMGSRSWKREDVERRKKLEDARQIEEIRRKMGLPEQQPEKPSGRSEEEIERKRKELEELMPLPKMGTKTPSPIEGATKPQEQESRSENPVYEKVSDENFDKYRQQGKEVILNEKTWRINDLDPNGNVILRRDITIDEASKLAERGKSGELHNVNSETTKIRGAIVTKGNLFRGQWIVEKPPRSPQNPERQKEVDAVKALQDRLTSGEFRQNKSGEYDLLEHVFKREAQRLNQEWQDYERSVGKK